jgi:hypothetical protein
LFIVFSFPFSRTSQPSVGFTCFCAHYGTRYQSKVKPLQGGRPAQP